MWSPAINLLRAFKVLYDLAFSEDQFYVEQRAEIPRWGSKMYRTSKGGLSESSTPYGMRQETVQGLARDPDICRVPGRVDRRSLNRTKNSPRLRSASAFPKGCRPMVTY
jgi:hypothetical protein